MKRSLTGLAVILLALTGCASGPSETPEERRERVRAAAIAVLTVELGADAVPYFETVIDSTVAEAIKYCGDVENRANYLAGIESGGNPWAVNVAEAAMDAACAPEFGY